MPGRKTPAGFPLTAVTPVLVGQWITECLWTDPGIFPVMPGRKTPAGFLLIAAIPTHAEQWIIRLKFANNKVK